MDRLYAFDMFNRVSATSHHMTFHNSLSLQANHLVFLHSYMIGIFLLSSMAGWFVLLFAALLFAIYAMYLIRPVGGAMLYTIFIAVISYSAFELQSYIEISCNLTNWMQALVGFGIILISFVCQLIGHSLHEEYTAPPRLTHGLFAAPILEIQSLILRLQLGDKQFQKEIGRIVIDNRSFLFNLSS